MINIGDLNLGVQVNEEDISNIPKKIGDTAKKAGNETEKEGKKTGEKLKSIASGIGTTISTVAKVGAAAIGTASAGVIALTKGAMDSYAEYEQLAGGTEKLFGSMANTIEQRAKDAYKTTQMSANDYLELTNEFSASMLKSVGGDSYQAANQVDKAISQMADNASVFGTDIEMIKTAYKGFARESFVALDNLKLGYAGSKEGMEQLLADAKEFSGIDYDISSYSDIVDAIQVIQEQQGIAGNAAKEASETIQGSIEMTKASWENLMTAFASGEDIGAALNDVIGSAEGVLNNVMPVVEQVLNSVVEALPTLMGTINEKLPELIQTILPTVITAATEIVQSLSEALPDLIGILAENIPGLAEQLIPAVLDMVMALFTSLASNIGSVLDTLLSVLQTIGQYLIDNVDTIIASVTEIIAQIVTWIGENIDTIITTVIEIIVQIATAIIENLPTILMAVIQAIPQIVAALIKAIPQILKAIAEITKALLKALGDFIKDLIAKFPEWWSNIKAKLASLSDKLKSLGQEWGAAIKDAVMAKVEEIIGKVKETWETVKGFFTGGSDGSNATGLSYVPYNGYLAELHEGERVLTADENKAYGQSSPSYYATYNITVPQNDNAFDTAIKLRDLTRREAYGFA